MTNTKILRELIKKSGLKQKHIANNLDISRYSFQKKIDNITEFKASEILILCEVLNIKDSNLKESIFFANRVD